jgi:hypothetical protein
MYAVWDVSWRGGRVWQRELCLESQGPRVERKSERAREKERERSFIDNQEVTGGR